MEQIINIVRELPEEKGRRYTVHILEIEPRRDKPEEH